jgi:hypothetical protein
MGWGGMNISEGMRALLAPINSDRIADGNALSRSAANYSATSIAARPSPGMNFGGNRN